MIVSITVEADSEPRLIDPTGLIVMQKPMICEPSISDDIEFKMINYYDSVYIFTLSSNEELTGLSVDRSEYWYGSGHSGAEMSRELRISSGYSQLYPIIISKETGYVVTDYRKFSLDLIVDKMVTSFYHEGLDVLERYGII